VVLENVLNEIDDEELEVYVVWIPVLAGDSLAEAEKAALTEVADDRVTHFWDGKQNLGRAYGKALEMPNGRQRPASGSHRLPNGRRPKEPSIWIRTRPWPRS